MPGNNILLLTSVPVGVQSWQVICQPEDRKYETADKRSPQRRLGNVAGGVWHVPGARRCGPGCHGGTSTHCSWWLRRPLLPAPATQKGGQRSNKLLFLLESCVVN